jgi:hypothetical protein
LTHQLVPYQATHRRSWDHTVERARNGHFMFRRGYLEYHGDRFNDRSFLLYRGHKLVALLPAHREADELRSHNGLSFGGWIQDPRCLLDDLRAGFSLLGEEMRAQDLRRLVYSPSPYPYHAEPCGDDLYVLSGLGATCRSMRLAAFVASPADLVRDSEFRRRLRRGAEALACDFEETDDVEVFWEHLADFVRQRHGTAPVHSAAEMRLLKTRFPENIRLIVGRSGDEWVIGQVVFLSRQVARSQYLFRRVDMPDVSLGFRVLEWFRGHPAMARVWMDLGTSMDPNSGDLQDSLHLHKEIFGARGVPLTTWVWQV